MLALKSIDDPILQRAILVYYLVLVLSYKLLLPLI